MGQIGCFVPASYVRFSVFNFIGTRMGAGDDLLHQKSTFMCELEETSTLLDMANPRSLLIIDELGRGTSTFDGTAIASAVVDYLLTTKCLAVFSTHLHLLIDAFRNRQEIQTLYMSFTQTSDHQLVLLYSLVQGVCPSSFGIQVAKMANLPDLVINHANKAVDLFGEYFQQISDNSGKNQIKIKK
ncbi:DNA mismatch repair protein msh6 [Anaeramoeba ignava]|uniref:DNA mismatch repair protein msh6 n=1 Tax=Anaeramoeba ignava TaxID=1746090 RepID=A0A9Q0LGQ1_ANAIG|nr:DNA mismatch repair protein msh6 [Anaeramoeba ignava]